MYSKRCLWANNFCTIETIFDCIFKLSTHWWLFWKRCWSTKAKIVNLYSASLIHVDRHKLPNKTLSIFLVWIISLVLSDDWCKSPDYKISIIAIVYPCIKKTCTSIHSTFPFVSSTYMYAIQRVMITYNDIRLWTTTDYSYWLGYYHEGMNYLYWLHLRKSWFNGYHLVSWIRHLHIIDPLRGLILVIFPFRVGHWDIMV